MHRHPALTLAGGNANFYSHPGKSLAASEKVKYIPSKYASGWLPQTNENLISNKNLYTNINSKSIHCCQSLETAQMSSRGV